MITPEKQEKLKERMERLGIREDELEEHFIRGSGKGGQKINKTASCVQLIHPPSGEKRGKLSRATCAVRRRGFAPSRSAIQISPW